MPRMTLAGFARHVAACNNAELPGGRRRLRLAGVPIGWIDPRLAPALTAALAARGLTAPDEGGFDVPDAALLETLGRTLAESGHFRFRNEAFDVMADHDGPSLGRPSFGQPSLGQPSLGQPSLGQIDRGALPAFGLLAAGVHVNGLVEKPDGTHLWVGRRAGNKLLDPGKLDHLVAGGISAGHSPEQTLVKEGDEECSLPPALARRAVKVAEITYSMQRPEGLRRDLLHCFDLTLPPDWVPVPNDGEVETFRLLPLDAVFAAVRDTDDFKFNVNLVLIDLFLRRGLLDRSGAEGRRLRAGLGGGP